MASSKSVDTMLEDILLELLYLKGPAKEPEPTEEELKQHAQQHQPPASLAWSYLPLIIVGVCGFLAWGVFMLLIKLDDISETDANYSEKTSQDTQTAADTIPNNLTPLPVHQRREATTPLPPAPPPTPGSVKTGEMAAQGAVTFRHYQDVGGPSTGQPRFWCYSSCQPRSAGIEGPVAELIPPEATNTRYGEEDPREHEIVQGMEMTDGGNVDTGRAENHDRNSLHAGDWLKEEKVDEEDSADVRTGTFRTPRKLQPHIKCRFETDVDQAEGKQYKGQGLKLSKVNKEDGKKSNGREEERSEVAIDQFAEVTCLDTATASLREGNTSNDDSETSHSNSAVESRDADYTGYVSVKSSQNIVHQRKTTKSKAKRKKIDAADNGGRKGVSRKNKPLKNSFVKNEHPKRNMNGTPQDESFKFGRKSNKKNLATASNVPGVSNKKRKQAFAVRDGRRENEYMRQMRLQNIMGNEFFRREEVSDSQSESVDQWPGLSNQATCGGDVSTLSQVSSHARSYFGPAGESRRLVVSERPSPTQRPRSGANARLGNTRVADMAFSIENGLFRDKNASKLSIPSLTGQSVKDWSRSPSPSNAPRYPRQNFVFSQFESNFAPSEIKRQLFTKNVAPLKDAALVHDVIPQLKGISKLTKQSGMSKTKFPAHGVKKSGQIKANVPRSLTSQHSDLAIDFKTKLPRGNNLLMLLNRMVKQFYNSYQIDDISAFQRQPGGGIFRFPRLRKRFGPYGKSLKSNRKDKTKPKKLYPHSYFQPKMNDSPFFTGSMPTELAQELKDQRNDTLQKQFFKNNTFLDIGKNCCSAVGLTNPMPLAHHRELINPEFHRKFNMVVTGTQTTQQNQYSPLNAPFTNVMYNIPKKECVAQRNSARRFNKMICNNPPSLGAACSTHTLDRRPCERKTRVDEENMVYHHNDSEVFRNRLLPMRSEIKSADLRRSNVRPTESKIVSATPEGTPKQEIIFLKPNLSDASRSISNIDVRDRYDNPYGWSVMSDGERDALFQVSEIFDNGDLRPSGPVAKTSRESFSVSPDRLERYQLWINSLKNVDKPGQVSSKITERALEKHNKTTKQRDQLTPAVKIRGLRKLANDFAATDNNQGLHKLASREYKISHTEIPSRSRPANIKIAPLSERKQRIRKVGHTHVNLESKSFKADSKVPVYPFRKSLDNSEADSALEFANTPSPGYISRIVQSHTNKAKQKSQNSKRSSQSPRGINREQYGSKNKRTSDKTIEQQVDKTTSVYAETPCRERQSITSQAALAMSAQEQANKQCIFKTGQSISGQSSKSRTSIYSTSSKSTRGSKRTRSECTKKTRNNVQSLEEKDIWPINSDNKRLKFLQFMNGDGNGEANEKRHSPANTVATLSAMDTPRSASNQPSSSPKSILKKPNSALSVLRSVDTSSLNIDQSLNQLPIQLFSDLSLSRVSNNPTLVVDEPSEGKQSQNSDTNLKTKQIVIGERVKPSNHELINSVDHRTKRVGEKHTESLRRSNMDGCKRSSVIARNTETRNDIREATPMGHHTSLRTKCRMAQTLPRRNSRPQSEKTERRSIQNPSGDHCSQQDSRIRQKKDMESHRPWRRGHQTHTKLQDLSVTGSMDEDKHQDKLSKSDARQEVKSLPRNKQTNKSPSIQGGSPDPSSPGFLLSWARGSSLESPRGSGHAVSFSQSNNPYEASELTKQKLDHSSGSKFVKQDGFRRSPPSPSCIIKTSSKFEKIRPEPLTEERSEKVNGNGHHLVKSSYGLLSKSLKNRTRESDNLYVKPEHPPISSSRDREKQFRDESLDTLIKNAPSDESSQPQGKVGINGRQSVYRHASKARRHAIKDESQGSVASSRRWRQPRQRSTGQALGTNNSASVLPRWRRLRFFDRSVALWLPQRYVQEPYASFNSFTQSRNPLETWTSGLNGEGDGYPAGSLLSLKDNPDEIEDRDLHVWDRRASSDSVDQGQMTSQLVDNNTLLSRDDSSSNKFDWYKPAAISQQHRRRVPGQRLFQSQVSRYPAERGLSSDFVPPQVTATSSPLRHRSESSGGLVAKQYADVANRFAEEIAPEKDFIHNVALETAQGTTDASTSPWTNEIQNQKKTGQSKCFVHAGPCLLSRSLSCPDLQRSQNNNNSSRALRVTSWFLCDDQLRHKASLKYSGKPDLLHELFSVSSKSPERAQSMVRPVPPTMKTNRQDGSVHFSYTIEASPYFISSASGAMSGSDLDTMLISPIISTALDRDCRDGQSSEQGVIEDEHHEKYS